MKILLDSHTLVWFLNGDQKCSWAARDAIEAFDANVFVSSVSAWGLATKVRSGRWNEAAEIAAHLENVLRDHDFSPLSVTVEHGSKAGSMPGAHRDPFDRMLAAQAIVEGMPLVTADPAFHHFDVEVIW